MRTRQLLIETCLIRSDQQAAYAQFKDDLWYRGLQVPLPEGYAKEGVSLDFRSSTAAENVDCVFIRVFGLGRLTMPRGHKEGVLERIATAAHERFPETGLTVHDAEHICEDISFPAPLAIAA